ncbi:MAG: hypothetical protein NT133_06735 [Alphaproteobacteria bacterium]|nr:hypothetical protein [Alphaproteobacteria bacterium]
MTGTLFNREVRPFLLILLALAVAAVIADVGLHLLDAVWVGRYLGIPGTLLILASTLYSLRKRKLIRMSTPATLLAWHEGLAWLGSLLVLVHAGVHFNALLGWLAVGAMLVTVTSGLTGKFLLQRARRHMEATRQRIRGQNLSAAETRQLLYWESLTFDVIAAWRRVHLPITLAFAVLATAHLVSIFLFWRWR